MQKCHFSCNNGRDVWGHVILETNSLESNRNADVSQNVLYLLARITAHEFCITHWKHLQIRTLYFRNITFILHKLETEKRNISKHEAEATFRGAELRLNPAFSKSSNRQQQQGVPTLKLLPPRRRGQGDLEDLLIPPKRQAQLIQKKKTLCAGVCECVCVSVSNSSLDELQLLLRC